MTTKPRPRRDRLASRTVRFDHLTAADAGLCDHDADIWAEHDALLPRYVVRVECPVCGAVAEYNTIDNEITAYDPNL